MRKFLGVLFTIFLVFPLITISLSIYSLSTWVFDRDFYIAAFNSDEIQSMVFSDENIKTIFRESFGEIKDIDPASLSSLFHSLISPQYFKEQTTILINQAFDFFEWRIDSLSIQLDLNELKAAFNGPNQQELLEELVKIIPACENSVNLQNLGATLCKPSIISDELFIEYFLKPNLPILLSSIPDKVTIVEPVNRSELFQNIPPLFQRYLTLAGIRTAILILCAITLLFWIFTAYIAEKSGKKRLLWLGWTLLIPSLLILISGLIANQTFVWNLLKNGMEHIGAFKTINLFSSMPEITHILQSLLAPKINSSFTLFGGISSSIGLGFIVWGAVQSRDD